MNIYLIVAIIILIIILFIYFNYIKKEGYRGYVHPLRDSNRRILNVMRYNALQDLNDIENQMIYTMSPMDRKILEGRRSDILKKLEIYFD